jgi:predicted tellurium resistance membrane protein TerC
MGKKRKRRIRILWWSLGQAIFFGILLIVCIVTLIIKIYPLTAVTFFCLVYGNFTMLLGNSINSNQDYADQNVNGSDKFGDYDAKADAYLDRDYK